MTEPKVVVIQSRRTPDRWVCAVCHRKYRGTVELGYVSISGEICCYCADAERYEEAIQQGDDPDEC